MGNEVQDGGVHPELVQVRNCANLLIMSRTHYFYFRISEADLNRIVEDHQKRFDELIKDSFDDDELAQFERQLDDIAALYVQPVMSELSFEDFYPDSNREDEQRAFFESCRSSICLDNLPYFESNPFQVSYLKLLLERFDDVLIDQGGVIELCFKQDYLNYLKRFKNMDSLLAPVVVKAPVTRTTRPIDPIEFLIHDVYSELTRLRVSGVQLDLDSQSDKVRKIVEVFQADDVDASEALRRTGLHPKDFDDTLERVKFWLRKL